MKADAKTVQEILYSPEQFLIPFFQRHYSWKVPHWQRLWDDLRALTTEAKPVRHFLGPLVCTPHNLMPGNVAEYLLIDGQQRLTTLTILLAAIRDLAKQNGAHELEEQIHEGYLIHKYQKGQHKYKVVPRTGDREVLFGVIDGDHGGFSRRDGVIRAYKFFRDAISAFCASDTEQSLRRLFGAATAQLSLVVINIDSENPYEIFDSLNSAGLPLEEADLIRNFIFMQIPLADQGTFNEKHWQPFEAMFEETEDYPVALSPTPFYRDYLMRNGTYSRKGNTFVDFKESLHTQSWEPEAVVKELKSYAAYELLLRRPATASDEALRKALRRITLLKVTTAHPLLFNLFNRKDAGTLSGEDFLGCIRDLESFVIRRAIVGESAKAYSKWFPEAILAIKNSPRADLQAYWTRRGWPDDQTFIDGLVTFDLYWREPQKCRAILEALEDSFGHKEQVPLEKLSIEHVMPQTIDDDKNGRAWQAMLGEQWQQVHETWLDTLGNLTLTGYNPNLSNKAFERKQKLLIESKVELNKHFCQLSDWRDELIKARGLELAKKVAAIWDRPADAPYKRQFDPLDIGINDGEVEDTDIPFKEYWTQFLRVLAKHSQLEPTSAPSDKCRLTFDSEREAARYVVECDSDEESVSVQLRFTGKYAASSLKILEAERGAIDAELNTTAEWQYEKPFSVTVYLDAVRTRDNDDWPRQHEWLATILPRFMQAIEPRIHTSKEGVDQKAIIKDFWTAFDAHLITTKSPVEYGSPSSSRWQDIDLRKNVFLWMNCSLTDNWVGGGIGFEGKKGLAAFDQAKGDIERLSEASGAKFEIEESDHCYFAAYRFARLTDRKHWPEYFEWLKRVLESSQQFFEDMAVKGTDKVVAASSASAVAEGA